MYICIHIHQNQIRISKYGIGCVSPNTASRSNHTIICVNASPWCAWKVEDCIITICKPPAHFAPALSARSSPVRKCECVPYCIYICRHTLAWWPPTHTKWVIMCMLTTRDTQSRSMYVTNYWLSMCIYIYVYIHIHI